MTKYTESLYAAFTNAPYHKSKTLKLFVKTKEHNQIEFSQSLMKADTEHLAHLFPNVFFTLEYFWPGIFSRVITFDLTGKGIVPPAPTAGISFDNSRGLWEARLTLDGKRVKVGRYETIEEAQEAQAAAHLDFHRRAAGLTSLGQFEYIEHPRGRVT